MKVNIEVKRELQWAVFATDCKEITSKVQEYLLDWAGDQAPEYGFENATREEAFVEIVRGYILSYGQELTDYSISWSTAAGVLRHFVEGGMMDVYYSQVDERLKSWGLEVNSSYSWDLYIALVCRDGQRLYDKLNHK